jgi:Uncharacterized protein conserved in bacteria
MYSSFIKAIEQQNVSVTLTTDLDKIDGDILVLLIGGGWEPYAAKAMHVFKGPVILYVHHAYICFYKSFLKRWNSRILFAYSTDFANLSYNKYASVNIPYYHVPFASDEQIFYPLPLEKRYDIVFLGNGNSGYGRERYISLLIDYVKKHNLEILLAGSGWEKYGYPYQIIAHGKLLNIVYNLSKICVNIHNDRQYLGIDLEMDANNRVFDLAMAQCCQISNGEQMIVKYFDKDEVVTADDPQEWINKVDYYLNHPEERDNVSQKARQRAINEHTWHFRAKEFIDIINENYHKYASKPQRVRPFTLLMRYLDQYMLPTYRITEIRIIRFFLKKLGLYKQV